MVLLIITMFGRPGTVPHPWPHGQVVLRRGLRRPTTGWQSGQLGLATRRGWQQCRVASGGWAVGRVGSWRVVQQSVRILVDTSRYIMEISWRYKGYIISWKYRGDIMEISWRYKGYIISWKYRGDIMEISWRYKGYIISWKYRGDIMEISWRYKGYIISWKYRGDIMENHGDTYVCFWMLMDVYGWFLSLLS